MNGRIPDPSRVPRNRPSATSGLTLVELLVAISIFMVIGLAAYSGLSSVLEAREFTDRRSDRLAEVQYAIDTLADDLRQAVARPVRSELRGGGHALAGDAGLPEFLRLTRTGWPNPADLPHSSLARITWELSDGRLLRSYQMQPDAVVATVTTRREMLDGIERIDLRFLDEGNEWRSRWPDLDALESSARLPRAVEITLELEDWGRITRLFDLPAGPWSMMSDRGPLQ